MSQGRRHRRKNEKIKHHPKSDITKKDKIIGLVVVVLIFIAAAIVAVYYSLSRSGLTLF
ncbi:hypothetical protein [Bizionia sp.]|jgi:hypothetical protein|uniref:hypothetical protein n=1 Tax=Bizionia sp. TaxID=1954480 RepID=UPI003A945A0A